VRKYVQRKWLLKGFAGVLLATLAGCQNLPFTQDKAPQQVALDEALLEQVEFYRPYEIYNADFEAKFLGAAVGIDCQSSWNQSAPEQSKALLALKADVLNAGGNAVVLAHCQAVELNQCSAAIQCDGEGYDIADPQGARQSHQTDTQETPLDKPNIWF